MKDDKQRFREEREKELEEALDRVLLFSSLLLSGLELSDAKVYEPYIRALLETAAHFCKVVVVEGEKKNDTQRFREEREKELEEALDRVRVPTTQIINFLVKKVFSKGVE